MLFLSMAEQFFPPGNNPDIPHLKTGILDRWQQLPLEHQAALMPALLEQLLQSDYGSWAVAAVQALEHHQPLPENGVVSIPQQEVVDTWNEHYFEERLLRLEPSLQRWARRMYYREDQLTHDDIMQAVRIVLWRRFSENPQEWGAYSQGRWMAYAKATYRWKVVSFHRDHRRKLGMVASDMPSIVNELDITDDEAISMVYTSQAQNGRFAYPREILLAELRADLEAAVQRGLDRLCVSQRRDMPKLIADMLEGYTLMETCQRHGWTRNRGVTLMRKLRTVFYEELTGQQKTGYLGSHHPLTEDEKQRIRALYARGLSYRKVAALVGRSASAVEGICKQYPPEVVNQVQTLRDQGLSYARIAEQIGRSKSYVGWVLQAALAEDTDKPHDRDGQDIAPEPGDT